MINRAHTYLSILATRTSAGCTCAVLIMFLLTVGSLNALITEGIDHRHAFSQRHLVHALIIRCKIYFVLFIFVVQAAHGKILTTKMSQYNHGKLTLGR